MEEMRAAAFGGERAWTITDRPPTGRGEPGCDMQTLAKTRWWRERRKLLLETSWKGNI